jgi:tRNA threonylcarbamoyladenosine modification (KEOPS) complex  Pcc1 subunit
MIQKIFPELIQAEISITGSKELLCTISCSLQPETQRLSSNRSKIEIHKSDKTLILIVKALDISAIRAALNSYLFWIKAILNAVERVQ